MELVTPDIADKIADAVHRAMAIPVDRRPWDKRTLCDYFGCSVRSVDSIVARPDFPKARRIGKEGRPRWIAGEVMRWFEAQT